MLHEYCTIPQSCSTRLPNVFVQPHYVSVRFTLHESINGHQAALQDDVMLPNTTNGLPGSGLPVPGATERPEPQIRAGLSLSCMLRNHLSDHYDYMNEYLEQGLDALRLLVAM